MNPTDRFFLTLLASLDAFAAEHVKHEAVHRRYREIRDDFIRSGSGQHLHGLEVANAELADSLNTSETAYIQALSHFTQVQTLVPDDLE